MPCSRSPRGMGIPACFAGFQANTQGESLWGSGPGPQPRGKLRGVESRPTVKGEVEGDQPGRGGACSWGGVLETPQSDRYCCGRYTSYWNALLFTMLLGRSHSDDCRFCMSWSKKSPQFRSICLFTQRRLKKYIPSNNQETSAHTFLV